MFNRRSEKESWGGSKTFKISFFFGLFRAAPTAYGSSQVTCWIRVAAASLHHSHSNARPLTHWIRPRIKPTSSWVLPRLVTLEPQKELQKSLFDFALFYFLMIFIFFHYSWFLVFCKFSAVQQRDPVTQTYIHAFFLSHYPPSCSVISDDIVPSAIQQDLIVYLFQRQ